jgi:hypothetical protein
VDKAKKGLETIIEKRNNSYTESLKAIEGSQGSEKLSLDGLKKKAIESLKEFKLIGENGKLDFTRSTFPSAQNSQLKEVLNRVNSWKDKSPTGLNDLKKIIDGYYKGTAESKGFDKSIVGLKKNVSSYLDETVPAIGEMNKKFAKECELIKNITKELSLKDGVSPTTALNKLTSIFNRNGEFREKFVKELGEEGGQEILDDIVGSMFTDWFPRGLTGRIISGIGGAALGGAGIVTGGATLPAAMVGGALASPRTVGKATTLLGKVSKKLPKVGSAVKTGVLSSVTKKKRENR